MTLKCIIVDDERSAIDVIQSYCLQTNNLDLKGEFTSSVKAIEFLNAEEVDLVFLDINMPLLTGLQFPEVAKKRPMIIYTTAYSEYAAKSYEKEAVDYLLKPIAFDLFMKAVNKALEWRKLKGTTSISRKSDENLIYIKSGPQLHQVKVDDILFLEKQGYYVEFNLETKKVLSRISLSQALELLPESDFVQVHKSFIVAMRHIDALEKGEIIIKKNSIPIGQSYRDNLSERVENKIIGS